MSSAIWSEKMNQAGKNYRSATGEKQRSTRKESWQSTTCRQLPCCFRFLSPINNLFLPRQQLFYSGMTMQNIFLTGLFQSLFIRMINHQINVCNLMQIGRRV